MFGTDFFVIGQISAGLSVTIGRLLAAALVLLIAMTVHEFAHNYVGYRMGDPTPRDLGRLTLNPLVHINWLGWAMWVVIGFGILGSAPISEWRMRDRRWGYFWAVAAGPLSNLALAAFAALLFRLGIWRFEFFRPTDFIFNLNQFMTLFFNLNLLLFLFNLLPFFPFDGWHMLRKLLPPREASVLESYQQQSMFIFFGLLILSFIGFNIFGLVLNPPYTFFARLLLGF